VITNQPVSNRPIQIKHKHLQRDALIYIRQSSRRQVLDHTGSTAVQRAQAERAAKWGWPEASIKVVDDDLGLSGATSYQRLGFQEMLLRMERDLVGLVMFHDVSRLSREPADAEAFLRRAIRAGVLIATADHLFDAGERDVAELFGFRVKSLLAWIDNAYRARNLQQARVARVAEGNAVSPPPVGYIVATRGKWVMDPDPAVRDAIARVFTLYLSLGSVPTVARYWDSQGLRFPCRRKGEIEWRPVTTHHIKAVLNNPMYAGDYSFGRSRVLPATETAKRRVMTRATDDWHVSRDHHDGYITRDQHAQIKALLRSRRIAARQPARGGGALLQSLLWCAEHNRPFRSRYNDRDRAPEVRRRPSYICQSSDRLGHIETCFVVPARLLDPLVVDRVLASLTPPAIDEALQATDAAILEHERVHQSQLRLLQQAKDAVDFATARYLAVLPDNIPAQQVAQRLLKEKTLAYESLGSAIADHVAARPRPVSSLDAEKVQLISQDLAAVWAAETTTNVDRKALLGTLVSRVLLKPTDQCMDVTIAWRGGLNETFRVLSSGGINAHIAALRARGANEGEIEDALNKSSILNRFGERMSRPAIWRRLTKMGINSKELRILAWKRVRELALEGYTRPEMLSELRTNGPVHPKGHWTRNRLDSALRGLSIGRAGVEPLPAGHSVAVRVQTNEEVVAAIAAGRKAGLQWREIAEDLNARGFRPLKARQFSARQLPVLFRAHLPNRRALVAFHPTRGRRRNLGAAKADGGRRSAPIATRAEPLE
jgi:DNA invertase Pin-like site-specific DNA recombinase